MNLMAAKSIELNSKSWAHYLMINRHPFTLATQFN